MESQQEAQKRAENIAEIAKRIANMLGRDRPVPLDVPLKELEHELEALKKYVKGPR
jgi:hypothetical protein